MTNWQQHNGFIQEFKKLGRKQKELESSFQKLKKLLDRQFDSENAIQVIAPGKIHHLKTDDEGWEIWKVEMMVKGLRPSQCPRIWFAKDGQTITFLAIASHVDNYDNNTIDSLAIERWSEIE